MRLAPEEIARMIIHLDAMLFQVLTEGAGIDPKTANELLVPVREFIFALIAALGIEYEWASCLTQKETEKKKLIQRVYESFRSFLTALNTQNQ